MDVHEALERDHEVDLDVACETHDAVQLLAVAFQYTDVAEAIGKVMSCIETERMAQVFRAAGFHKVGDLLVREHAAYDTDMTAEDIELWHGPVAEA